MAVAMTVVRMVVAVVMSATGVVVVMFVTVKRERALGAKSEQRAVFRRG